MSACPVSVQRSKPKNTQKEGGLCTSNKIVTTHPPNMKLLSVGSNLLSHTLPSAVPSARRRLSFRVRNGTGRFPAAINHRHNQPDNTTNQQQSVHVSVDHTQTRVWCVKHCIVDANNKTIFSYTQHTTKNNWQGKFVVVVR